MDDWIDWEGGECPVEKGTLVDVMYRSGHTSYGVPAMVPYDDMEPQPKLSEGGVADDWYDDGVSGDIIKYKLSQQTETV